MTDLNFLQNTILTTAEKMEKTILTPAQLSLTDQINLLQLENLNLETEIIRLKTQIADQNIAILKASLLFDEVLKEYAI